MLEDAKTAGKLRGKSKTLIKKRAKAVQGKKTIA
jgi:hypothetical protein